MIEALIIRALDPRRALGLPLDDAEEPADG
jgi:hypothetical protein